MNNEAALKKQTERKKASRRKYIIAYGILLLCILVGYIYRLLTWTPVETKFQKDSERILLETAVWQLNHSFKIEKYPNDLTDEDFTKLSEFDLFNKDITDLKLLEKCSNLEILDFQQNHFPKEAIPKWMDYMSKLGFLDLSERFSIDLNAIENLTKLRDIRIDGCSISSIEPLRNLQNLERLNIAGTFVSDLEPLRNLVNLDFLWCNVCYNISDLEPLKGLVALKEMHFQFCSKITNLEPLRNLENLSELCLEGTGITDIEPLKGLKKLQILTLDKTQISDIEPLRELTNLRILRLRNTKVSNLEPLKNLKNLEDLYIEDSLVTNIEPIKELVQLRGLDLSGLDIKDYEPLRNLTNLNGLGLKRTQISDLKVIKGCSKLKALYLNDCENITLQKIDEIRDISPKLRIHFYHEKTLTEIENEKNKNTKR